MKADHEAAKKHATAKRMLRTDADRNLDAAYLELREQAKGLIKLADSGLAVFPSKALRKALEE